ncbi:unnamed protein product, partial [Mesorhabditis spiculigera]
MEFMPQQPEKPPTLAIPEDEVLKLVNFTDPFRCEEPAVVQQTLTPAGPLVSFEAIRLRKATLDSPSTSSSGAPEDVKPNFLQFAGFATPTSNDSQIPAEAGEQKATIAGVFNFLSSQFGADTDGPDRRARLWRRAKLTAQRMNETQTPKDDLRKNRTVRLPRQPLGTDPQTRRMERQKRDRERQAWNRTMQYAMETPEQREERRRVLRERAYAARDRRLAAESPEQREERLKAYREKASMRRALRDASETPEERKIRLKRVAEAAAMRRASSRQRDSQPPRKESEHQRQSFTPEVLYSHQPVKQEPVEEKPFPSTPQNTYSPLLELRKDENSQRFRRETSEERELRKAKNREKLRQTRSQRAARETPEERQIRLKKIADAVAVRRFVKQALESPEQREERLRIQREYVAARRKAKLEAETPEERAERLQREAAQKKKLDQERRNRLAAENREFYLDVRRFVPRDRSVRDPYNENENFDGNSNSVADSGETALPESPEPDDAEEDLPIDGQWGKILKWAEGTNQAEISE